MKHFKLPIPVIVIFATADGVIMTLEGPVSHVAGDAILTGSAGEQWPIPRAIFEATYAPVAPLRSGESGAYIKKAIPVEARQADRAEVITLGDGRGEIQAQPEDWIVTAPDGRQWVVAEAIFRMTYRVAD